MFKFENNPQIKKEIKKLFIDENLKMTDVGKMCGLIPQELNNRLNNKKLAFIDIQKYLDVCGYDLYIDFVKREKWSWIYTDAIFFNIANGCHVVI